LHIIEFLNHFALIEMRLDLIVCSNFLLKHWIDKVLEKLPEQEEIVALGDHELSVHRIGRFVELCKCFLELERDVLIKPKHF
jgi:hypothetical protein